MASCGCGGDGFCGCCVCSDGFWGVDGMGFVAGCRCDDEFCGSCECGYGFCGRLWVL